MPEFELPSHKLGPLRDIIFTWQHRDPEGKIIAEGQKHLDLMTNQGLNWLSSQGWGTVTGAGVVMCVGTGTASPTMGDLTLGGEITGSGLSRTTGSTSGVGALTGLAAGATTNQTTGSFYVYYTFTASGSVTVNEAGVSPSAVYNSGIIVHELLSPVATMGVGDTLFNQFQFIL